MYFVPYQFGNSTGRLRGTPKGNNQKLLEFRGSLITNGEKPLTTFTSEGGSKRRVIELQTPDVLFDVKLVKQIYATIADNYGLFGIDWIKFLQSCNQDELKTVYNQKFDELLESHPDKVPRHLMSLAACMTALQYFSVACLQINEEGVFDWTSIVSQLPDMREIADYIRAKTLIQEWIASHPKNFCTDDDCTGYEMYGVQRNGYIAVFPTYLRRLLADNGMSPEVIIKQLADIGFIQSDKDHITRGVKINNKIIRMYCINI